MRTGLLLLAIIAATDAGATSLDVYADALANGFSDQSWANGADYDLANTAPVHGGSDSIRFTPDVWGGLQFVANGSEFNFIDYQSLSFWVHGGSGAGAGEQTIWVVITDNYDAVSATIDVASLVPGGVLLPDAWQLATLDFNEAALTVGTFNGINIMDGTGTLQHELYIDDIVFDERTSAPPGGGSVAVGVDASSNVHPFSPNIFGVAFGDAARNAEIGYTVRRWGGNSVTRYNWQVDVHNTAFDYYYENIPGASDRTQIPPIGNDADAFVGETLDAGSQPLMTIPTIGWTPRADSPLNHPYFAGFSVMRYGAQQSTDPYDPDAGNGIHTNGTPITGNDPHDTSSEVAAAFQQGWIAHFQSTFGNAAGGGVRFYSLDNEVMLWNSTHRDVHPDPTTYDETWANALSYGGMIKQQDPGCEGHRAGDVGLLRSVRVGRRQLSRRLRSPGARRHAVRRVVSATGVRESARRRRACRRLSRSALLPAGPERRAQRRRFAGDRGAAPALAEGALRSGLGFRIVDFRSRRRRRNTTTTSRT